jgi:PAS domain S-box-containing protein
MPHLDVDGRTSAEFLSHQNHVLELVARGAALDETLTDLLRGIEAQAPGMLASILLLDRDGLHLRHSAAPRLPEAYTRAIDGKPIGPQAGSCGTAAFRREPVIVGDIATDPLWTAYRELALAHGLRACWSTPICDGQRRVVGTFAMYFTEPRLPTPADRALIEVTTYLATIAIVQHREREELKRHEAQLAEAQQIAEVGSYEWDLRTYQVRRSVELCRIFGLRREDFEPTFDAYLARVHPEDRDRTRQSIERAHRDFAPFDFEERIVRPDGSVRRLRSQGKWIRDEAGSPVKLVGTCQDITERRRTEEQLRRTEELRRRNEELDAFAYMVSHDLKAPLRAIAGYARELDRAHRTRLDGRGQTCVAQILSATQNLDRLIEDLLHYSRIDVEPASATRVDLRRLINGILRDRKLLLDAQGVELKVQLDVACVDTWERGLTQILSNLLDNAVKYSRDATPPVVRVWSQDLDDVVRIAIADNGVGFDMKHHDRMFGLFNRLEGHERFEGTGAGLAIVKKIAEKIGARVRAEAAPRAGATFMVDLPTSGPAG